MLFLDVETRSELNISDRRKDLPAVSVDLYCKHPSTEVLCLAWAVDKQPVKGFSFRYENDHDDGLFGVTKSKGDDLSLLDDLKEAAVSHGPVVAHNSSFEEGIWDNKLVPLYDFPELSADDWRCTMALCGHYGAPLGLGDAAGFLGVDSQKMDGSVTRKLCLPVPKWFRDPAVRKWAGTREDFANLNIYCQGDVAAHRDIFYSCPNLETSGELRVWQVSQEINRRGIYVDPDLVRECTKKAAELRAMSGRELVELTEGAVNTPKQGDRITGWLARHGYHLPNAQQKTFEEFLDENPGLPEEVHRVVELRLGGAGAAETKFPAIMSRMSKDGRVRGCFTYYGARTGRWTARGVQPQNLKKPSKDFDFDLIGQLIEDIQAGDWAAAGVFGNTRDILAAMLRPAFCAPPGKTLVCQDYSSIEGRITAWLAGEEQKLDIYRNGGDPYIDLAKKIDRLNPNRQLGKAGELSLGFGASNVDNFVTACRVKFGVKVTPEQAAHVIKVFQGNNPRIKRYWYQLFGAFRAAVEFPGEVKTAGKIQCKYLKDRDVLYMRLPSGRCLFYHEPRLDPKPSYKGRLGADEKGGVGRVHLWHGKFVENAVQAVAADVQRHAIVSLAKYLPEAPVVLHSHDEIVTEVDEADAQRIYELQKTLMLALPAWGADIPMDAAGWIGRRYRKD